MAPGYCPAVNTCGIPCQTRVKFSNFSLQRSQAEPFQSTPPLLPNFICYVSERRTLVLLTRIFPPSLQSFPKLRDRSFRDSRVTFGAGRYSRGPPSPFNYDRKESRVCPIQLKINSLRNSFLSARWRKRAELILNSLQ
jgi:hypothetical protein